MNFLRILCSSFGFLFLVGCDHGPEVIKISGAKFGTLYSVIIIADQIPPPNLEELIDDRLDLIDISMSTYKVDSEISEFNRLMPGEKSSISDDFVSVYRTSKEIWEISNGAFNPAVGPLVDLWGFGPEKKNDHIPVAQEIDKLLLASKFSNVSLQNSDDNFNLVKLDNVNLDFSGVAKGYAADVIADLLEMSALPNYLIEIGGEMRVSGVNSEDKPWRLAIESPSEIKRIETIISGINGGVATSGDYRNYFEVENERYSHTLDPRTGYPVKHSLASVTVIAETGARADALATALMVMGEIEGMKMAEKNNIPTFMVTRIDQDYQTSYSSSMDKYLNYGAVGID